MMVNEGTRTGHQEEIMRQQRKPENSKKARVKEEEVYEKLTASLPLSGRR